MTQKLVIQRENKQRNTKNILWIFIDLQPIFVFIPFTSVRQLNMFLLSYVQQQFDFFIYCIILSPIFTSKKRIANFLCQKNAFIILTPFYCNQFTFGLSYKNVSLIGCICKLTDLEQNRFNRSFDFLNIGRLIIFPQTLNNNNSR